VSVRIDPPPRYSWFARLAFRSAKRATGKVPDPLRIFARRPRLLLSTVVFEWAVARTPKLGQRLKVLAGLRVSTLIGCPF
jgi:hypothetical protein